MSELQVGTGWYSPRLGTDGGLSILVKVTEDGALFTTSIGGTYGCRVCDVTSKRAPAPPEIIQAGIAEAERTIARLQARADKLRDALELLKSTEATG